MKTKISYGIALCRYNSDNVTEIVLVKKRYSYSFFSFVMGQYKKNDSKYIKYLFDTMSYSEKLDILSLEFNHMWYRIWLNNPNLCYDIGDVYKNMNFADKPIGKRFLNFDINKLYTEKKIKFDRNFLYDGGKRLLNMIHQSKNAEILWEIPKGGKIDTNSESNIDAATREFYEETSIKSYNYKILYDIPPVIDSYIDNDILYKTVYYIASLNEQSCDLAPGINYKNFSQITEVEQVKWVSKAEIKFFNMSHNMNKRLIKLYSDILIKFKKNNKIKKLVF